MMASFFGKPGDNHDWLSWAMSYHKRYILCRRIETSRNRKCKGKLKQGIHDNAPAHTSQFAMAAATDCEFEILPNSPLSPDLPPLSPTCFQNWKPSYVKDVLEAMKVSWRRSISSLRTKIESYILKS
jgi:hypothetical protein